MTIAQAARLWFLALYALGLTVFIVTAIRFRLHRRGDVEKQVGPAPTPGILVPLGIPFVILLTRVGALSAHLLPLRLLGVALSLYFLVMFFWTMRTLGDHYAPGFVVFEDHELITSGPYALVRHPIGSSALALWLAAGLGTMNWLLLLLWPFFYIASSVLMVRTEEALLYEKFGAEYEEYAQRTGALIPRIG